MPLRRLLRSVPSHLTRGTPLDLRDYLRLLRRSWMWIVSASLIGIAAGGVLTYTLKPTYTAETQLFVAIQNSGSAQELQQGNTFSQARVQSYVKTIKTPIVLQPVIDTLGLQISSDELAVKVKGATDPNTVLINISVEDYSPVQSAAIAQAVADSLITAVDQLEKPKSSGSSPVSLSVVRPAVAPLAPTSPNTQFNIALGFFLGLATGIITALLISSMDNRIRGEKELRILTQAPLLGGIAYATDAAKNPLLTQSAAHSPRAESFRQLRTNLKFANVSAQARTVLITSSLPSEGKSTTATNLALALAQSGQRVCLVDADLRRPMIHDYLGLEKDAGLTTALVGQADVEELLQPWGEDQLFVLTSGVIPPNPSELLGSDEMKALVARLGQAFDTVIVDAPPLLPVTDAAILAQYVGGVILVVGAKKTTSHHLAKSLSALELVGANLLGIVLNSLPLKEQEAYGYGYYGRGNSSPSIRAAQGTHVGNFRPESRYPEQFRSEASDSSELPVHPVQTSRRANKIY